MKVTREGPLRITRTTIEAAWARRAKDQRLVIGDAECRGLALVVNPSSMAWVYSYKPRGTDPTTGKRFASKSVTIGNPETHSPPDARTQAEALKGATKAGRDPAAEKRAKIAEDAVKRAGTLDRLLEEYGEDLPSRPKMRGTGVITAAHAAAELAQAKAAVAAMRAEKKPARDVASEDLWTFLRAAAKSPGVARARFGALSRFFDWLLETKRIAVNPCDAIPKSRRPRPPAPRKGLLRPDQLAVLWHAADRAEDLQAVHRDLFRFLIAIPSRKNEAAGMDWKNVDLTQGVWTQPGRLTKNGDPHRLSLHPLALDILRQRFEAAKKPKAGLVFPAPRSGKRIATWTDLKTAVTKAAELDGWTFQDFRRSFATFLGEIGKSEAVVDAILNHRQAATRGGVLGVYQWAKRWPEQAAVMEAWGAALQAAVKGEQPGGDVVPLRRA
jgi:integrase